MSSTDFSTAYDDLSDKEKRLIEQQKANDLKSGKVIHDSTNKGPCPICEHRVSKGLQTHINQCVLACDECMDRMSKVPKGNIQQYENYGVYFGNHLRKRNK